MCEGTCFKVEKDKAFQNIVIEYKVNEEVLPVNSKALLPCYKGKASSEFKQKFLQIKPDTHVYESDIEHALLDHLQEFLLELGRGFSFVARQKRFIVDGQDFFIDLVFYNYILKCFVLFDLKTGTLTHQDLGQMQMYINYYTRELMNEGDKPPIGIVLCAEKNDARYLHQNTIPICRQKKN